ncbi:3-deoxy-D-arabinoheptulosonate-7-phosphate synthase [Malonomonas rubra DSM 5091]|uniref:Phospho-2-dehydro-3-deoxyheptonate aldolase n=1 Tax=Malonomonas rubra DSM 5091 TaxID=1122189 RepID=A0A1M6BEY6_MALRU|nr:3-deoxy-7-phosphoheptulonate synthase [Malonomonas rubra]SHI47013.1 3-deoxy-D-arabinoheptulosonate-7-phosphate synthase [Malonomonas rubra DSM 5091]
MVQTNNINVREVTPIIAPEDLKQVFPLDLKDAAFVNDSRNAIKDILHGDDKRMIVVVGPCSIHDPKAAIEYAEKLAALSQKVQDKLLVVMRVYFEKPRTTVGWKGLINDPDMDGSHKISKGLGIARQLFSQITQLHLPIASEMLEPIIPHYLSDMISWGAIGARTTESQTHREMASGLSFPVGFKNGTDGGLKIATDAMAAARCSHSFLGINYAGRSSVVETTGNPDIHIVLRGGNDGPNYSPDDIAATTELLKKNNLPPSIMVDCSHANSYKNHERQGEVLDSIVEQIATGTTSINGVMIESNLKAGNQSIPDDLSQLKYGVSVTDKCVDWETTEDMLLRTFNRLA